MDTITPVRFVARGELQAVQLHIGNTDRVAAWCGGEVTMGGEGDHIVVHLLDGGVKVAGPGDWVTTTDGTRFGVLTDVQLRQRYVSAEHDELATALARVAELERQVEVLNEHKRQLVVAGQAIGEHARRAGAR